MIASPTHPTRNPTCSHTIASSCLSIPTGLFARVIDNPVHRVSHKLKVRLSFAFHAGPNIHTKVILDLVRVRETQSALEPGSAAFHAMYIDCRVGSWTYFFPCALGLLGLPLNLVRTLLKSDNEERSKLVIRSRNLRRTRCATTCWIIRCSHRGLLCLLCPPEKCENPDTLGCSADSDTPPYAP